MDVSDTRVRGRGWSLSSVPGLPGHLRRMRAEGTRSGFAERRNSSRPGTLSYRKDGAVTAVASKPESQVRGLHHPASPQRRLAVHQAPRAPVLHGAAFFQRPLREIQTCIPRQSVDVFSAAGKCAPLTKQSGSDNQFPNPFKTGPRRFKRAKQRPL